MTEPIRRLGRYEIVGEVGKGGFATVYRGRDLELAREVALKILDPLLTRDPVWVARFRREARAVASLEHPRIVTIYEIGQAEGLLYIAMKLVDGGSLAQRLAQNGRLAWSETVRLAGEIGQALDFAHGKGVVHRDLKPANVLLDSQTGSVLTDFGFARLVADNSLSVSMSGGVVGTPAYIAPEVWEGADPSPQADIYALGCMVYEMITGRALFTGATPPAVMLAHFKPPALPETWPDDVPAGVGELLATALDKDPAARYARAGDFAAALAGLTEDVLARPYAALQAAVAAQAWPEALALAGEIRVGQADYRDVAALERQAAAGLERAARVQSAAQWRATAEEALAAGDLAGAQVAVRQWQELTPEDSELVNVRERLQLQQASAASVAATRGIERETEGVENHVSNSLPHRPIVSPGSPARTERPSTRTRGGWLLLAGVGALAAIVVLAIALRSGDNRSAAGVAVVSKTATSVGVAISSTNTAIAPIAPVETSITTSVPPTPTLAPPRKTSLPRSAATPVGTLTHAVPSIPSNDKYRIWVVANIDSACCDASYEDTLTIMSYDGHILQTMPGLNYSQTVGGQRRLAVSPDGQYALVADEGDYTRGRLMRFGSSGSRDWTLTLDYDGSIDAVIITSDGQAYALVSEGTIYGKNLLQIDPESGRVLRTFPFGGFDLVSDEQNNVIWLVGADVKKLDLEGNLVLDKDMIGWTAVSVDLDVDGSVWFAERQHPDVPGSQDRLINLSSTGEMLAAVPLDFSPSALRVDKDRGHVWVASWDGLHKFDRNGKQVTLSSRVPAFTVALDPGDGSVWATSFESVGHYSSNGTKITATDGFSGDQDFIAIP